MVAKKEVDISTKMALLELECEQNTENIANLDKRMIAQEKNNRQNRTILISLSGQKAERWIAIAITIINLLILLLNRSSP